MLLFNIIFFPYEGYINVLLMFLIPKYPLKPLVSPIINALLMLLLTA